MYKIIFMKENQLCFEKQENFVFNEILNVRQKTQEIEVEIEHLKELELISFKRKYESFKTNVKYNVQHDLIYAALFGNNIII